MIQTVRDLYVSEDEMRWISTGASLIKPKWSLPPSFHFLYYATELKDENRSYTELYHPSHLFGVDDGYELISGLGVGFVYNFGQGLGHCRDITKSVSVNVVMLMREIASSETALGPFQLKYQPKQ